MERLLSIIIAAFLCGHVCAIDVRDFGAIGDGRHLDSPAINAAIKEAERRGSGVIAVNGKMVDRPVVLRAQRTIDLAIASGILKEEDIV